MRINSYVSHPVTPRSESTLITVVSNKPRQAPDIWVAEAYKAISCAKLFLSLPGPLK
jgi:hypothetical protein